MPFWFWNDTLDAGELVRQLDAFHRKGIDGVVLHPRLGMSGVGYLSDEYFALVRTVKLAWLLTKLEGNPYLDSSREKAVVSPREGQDRYIKQLDEYLKNGIIDRAEYKILRERYGRR